MQKKHMWTTVTGNEKSLYFWAALIMSLVGGGLFLLAGIGTKEVVPQNDEIPTFKESMKYLFTNKYLMLVLLCNLLAFPKSIGGMLQIYVAKYILGSQDMVLILGIPAAVGSMISMIFAPFFMKKFGAIKTYLIANIYSLIPMGVLYFIGLTFVGKGSVSSVGLTIILIFIFLNSLSNGIIGIIPPILIADSIDWMEYKTGQRNEGVSFSIRTFIAKATSAFQTKVSTIALVAIHYIQPPKGVDYVSQSASTIKGLWAWYTVLPVVLSLLSIVPLLFYDLKGEKLDKVHDGLAARRKSNEDQVS
jgi:Na+/melibiose symporter-like transporter